MNKRLALALIPSACLPALRNLRSMVSRLIPISKSVPARKSERIRFIASYDQRNLPPSPVLANKEHLRYWNNTNRFEKFNRWCGDFDQPFREEIRKRVIDKKYKNILDAGAGVFSEYYGFKHDKYDISYTAIEITPLFVEYGLQRGINVIRGDLADMPFDDEQFDCCLCEDTLNHQIEFKAPILEMLRVVKKEVFISFFKPFAEDVDSTGNLSGKFKIEHTENGVIEHRFVDEKKETICLYNYFSKQKIIEFLVEAKFRHEFIKSADGRIILVLNK